MQKRKFMQCTYVIICIMIDTEIFPSKALCGFKQVQVDISG